MMRGDLCRHVHTARLRLAYQLNGTRRADVGNMDMRTRILGEHDVARDGNILGDNRTPLDAEHRTAMPLIHGAILYERGIFLMIDDCLIKRRKIVVCTEENLCRRVEMTIV